MAKWTEQEREQFTKFINEVLYEKLTTQDYYNIMRKLGAENRGDRFRTICHNIDGGKFNLAFNEDDKYFTCFSECGCSYSLLSLVKKRRELLGQPCSTYQSMKWICEQVGIDFNFKEEVKQVKNNVYHWQGLLKYSTKNKNIIELKEYNDDILNRLDNFYYLDWIEYGISSKTLDKFEIKWYNYKQQIVIPCRDEYNKLIGIRIRNTNPEEEIKYKPLELLNGMTYKFPTNLFFYGENFNKKNIIRTKSVMLVEAEKTVMKFDEWYGENNNICLGLYGSTLSDEKIKKLLEWGCENFYIALDSDFYKKEYSKDKNILTPYEVFEKKVMKISQKLKPYAKNIYVVYNNLDFENCYKFSITDYTKEQFEKLWENKELIINE